MLFSMAPLGKPKRKIQEPAPLTIPAPVPAKRPAPQKVPVPVGTN